MKTGVREIDAEAVGTGDEVADLLAGFTTDNAVIDAGGDRAVILDRFRLNATGSLSTHDRRTEAAPGLDEVAMTICGSTLSPPTSEPTEPNRCVVAHKRCSTPRSSPTPIDNSDGRTADSRRPGTAPVGPTTGR